MDKDLVCKLIMRPIAVLKGWMTTFYMRTVCALYNRLNIFNLKTYPGISCCAEKLIKFGMNVLWDIKNTKQSSKVWVGILVFILYLILEYT